MLNTTCPQGAAGKNSNEYHYTLTKMAKIPRLTIPSAVQNVEQQQLWFIPGGNAKRHWEGGLAVCYEAKQSYELSSSYVPRYAPNWVENFCTHKIVYMCTCLQQFYS